MMDAQELTNRQSLTVYHVITSATHEEACKKAKISKGTLYAWLKEESFQAELKRQRDEVIKDSLGRLKCAATKAIDGLIGLMDTSKPDLKRWVCKDIIDYTLKVIELEDIEKRLKEVERIVSEKEKG